MKALIIDDNAIVLEGCRRILEAENIEAATSSSVTEALQMLENGEYDLLLTDIIMPDKDGFYLIGEVRKRWPDLPIVVMSGYPTPEFIERIQQAGAVRFVPKPFTPKELLAEVRLALQL